MLFHAVLRRKELIIVMILLLRYDIVADHAQLFEDEISW